MGIETPKVLEWLKANGFEYTDREKLIGECMAATGRGRDTVVRGMKRIGLCAGRTLKTTAANSGLTPDALRRRTVSMADIIKPHDKVGRVLEIIAEIPSGEFIDDETIRKEVSVSRDRWRSVRGSTRLAGHWYQMPDKSTVWGARDDIDSLDERIREIT